MMGCMLHILGACDPWLSIYIHQILFDRFYILRIHIYDICLLLSETQIQTNILDVAKLNHQ